MPVVVAVVECHLTWFTMIPNVEMLGIKSLSHRNRARIVSVTLPKKHIRFDVFLTTSSIENTSIVMIGSAK